MLRATPPHDDGLSSICKADGGMLSTDLDGSILPPAGSPNYFFEWYNTSPGQLAEYKFHVDWSPAAVNLHRAIRSSR